MDVTYCDMDRVSVQTDGLAVPGIVSGESVLHELERSIITRRAVPVCCIPITSISSLRFIRIDEIATHNHGSIKCGPTTPLLSKNAYIGISQSPGSLGSPLHNPA